ncbi:MAG: hypothetical protein JWL70_1386 [Acidimicrobiia bacterium]|nr:hypothetical protein [Acidimicrobiia bacterium]
MPRSLRRLLSGAALLVVVEYLVLPQIAGTRRAVHLLAGVSPALVALGIAIEVTSWMSYAQLTRSLLPTAGRPSLSRIARIQMTTLALSHVVPAGSVAGTGLGYRLLMDAGVSPPDAGFALATQGLGSAVVLNVILWISLLVTIPTQGFQPIYTTAAGVGAVLLTVLGVVVFVLGRHEDDAARAVSRLTRPLPFIDQHSAARLVCGAATRIHELAADPRRLVHALGWAAANWVLDAGSLWVFLAAFGYRISVDGLLVSYGLANVLAAIPITPGGLGIVEGVLTPSLVGFGAPRGIAILGVISWRLVNFWAPVPLGATTYLSLHGHSRRDPNAPLALNREVAVAREAVPTPREWARDHGVRVE